MLEHLTCGSPPKHSLGIVVEPMSWCLQSAGLDIASPDQVTLDMAGPKAGRQRMAIAAEGGSAHSNVEIVKAAKSPAVLDLLGTVKAVCMV